MTGIQGRTCSSPHSVYTTSIQLLQHTCATHPSNSNYTHSLVSNVPLPGPRPYCYNWATRHQSSTGQVDQVGTTRAEPHRAAGTTYTVDGAEAETSEARTQYKRCRYTIQSQSAWLEKALMGQLGSLGGMEDANNGWSRAGTNLVERMGI